MYHHVCFDVMKSPVVITMFFFFINLFYATCVETCQIDSFCFHSFKGGETQYEKRLMDIEYLVAINCGLTHFFK